MIFKKKINISKILFAILLIPYLEPLLFKEEQFEIFDTIYTYMKIVCLAIIIYCFVRYNYPKIKITKCSMLILVLELFTFFTTIYNNGDIVKFCGPAVSIIALTLLTETFFRILKLDYFRIIRNELFILTIINIIFQIKFPYGILPEINFLGIDNRLVFFYIPLIVFSGIYDYYNENKISKFTLVTMIITLWSTIRLWAVGGFLGLILISGIILLNKFAKMLKKLSLKKLIILIILINILVVFLQIQKYFEFLIVDVLHKDLTLTGRTYLWDWAIESIKQKTLIGFGIQSDEYLLNIYYWVAHPHNMFLNYLTTTGIIGFCLYMMILFVTARESGKIDNDKTKVLLGFTVFVILFLSIADTLDTAIFYTIYVVINLLSEYKDLNVNYKKNNNCMSIK